MISGIIFGILIGLAAICFIVDYYVFDPLQDDIDKKKKDK